MPTQPEASREGRDTSPGAGVRYPPEVLERLRGLAAGAGAGRERCGIVTRSAGGWKVSALPNTARLPDAFEVEPAALLRALRELASGAGELVAFWHTHLDAPAHFSERDREGATAGGEPLWPGVEHLVVAVRGGRAADVERYRLAGSRVERLPLDGSAPQ